MRDNVRTYSKVPWKEILRTYGILFASTVCIVFPLIILEGLKIIPEHFKNAKFESVYEDGIGAGLFASGVTFFLLLYQIVIKVFFKKKIYDKPDENDNK